MGGSVESSVGLQRLRPTASQDRSTGRVVFRFRDEQGRLVALRMRRRQFQTFANRADDLAEALDE